MDIENQKITIRVNNFNEKHFVSLGYKFEKNEYITIPAGHLPKGSGFKIDVICSYCGNQFKKPYRRYLETIKEICCKKCKDKKMVKTSIRKYGNPCSLRNPLILKKSKDKNMSNLGVEYPFQNREILKKCRETHIKRYGKWRAVKVSSQQKRIHSLYGGELDKNCFPYYLDIFFENEKIYFEYDGSGHKLGIRFGVRTEEEFNDYQTKRRTYLKNLGYKEFRIVSEKDLLPALDKELLEIKKRAFEILLIKNYSSYIYNADTKTESFEY